MFCKEVVFFKEVVYTIFIRYVGEEERQARNGSPDNRANSL